MKKDIFIDASIANKFAKPNESYRLLIQWLVRIDKENPENNAYLVISDKLKAEYWGGNQCCQHEFGIRHIYAILQREGRLIPYSADTIQDFIKKQVLPNKNRLKIRCGKKDWNHFPLIFFSNRKMAIIQDKAFANAVLNFPPFSKNVIVAHEPHDLDYK